MAVFRRFCRWFAGIVLCASLIGTGFGVYHWVRLLPRCVINTATHDLRAYCYDPEFMITASGHISDASKRSRENLKTPLLVWHTHSGAIVRKLLNDVSSAEYLVFAKDHQLFMAYLGNGNSRLVEWRTGKEWDIATGCPDEHRGFRFSPRGDWFYVYDAAHKQPHLLVDVAQREPDVRLDGDQQPAHGFSPDGGRLYFWKDTCLQAWNTRTRRLDGSIAVQPPVFFDEPARRFAVYSADGTEILVWDAVAFMPLARIRPAIPRAFIVAHKDTEVAAEDADRKLNRSQRAIVFSPNGKVLATYPQQQEFKRNSVLEFWEADSGRKRASFALQTKIHGSFTTDDSFLLQDATIDSFNRFKSSIEGHFQLLDTATARIRWADSLQVGKLFPLSDSQLIRLDKSDCWETLDATTGETLSRTPHSFKAEFRAAHSGRHERYLCLFGQSRPPDFPAIVESWLARWIQAAGAVQVIDKETGQVVYERRIGAEEFAHVSGDGTTLITFAIVPGEDSGAGNGPIQANRTYRYAFYDLYSAKPWIWAVAVPAALVVLVALWRFRRAKGK